MLGDDVDGFRQRHTQLIFRECFIRVPSSEFYKRFLHVRGQFGFLAKLDHALAAAAQGFTFFAITLPDSFSATRNS